MLSVIETINTTVNNFIWGVPAMICIFGVGLYLSLRTRFFQIRKFPYAIRTTLGRMFRKRSDGHRSPAEARCGTSEPAPAPVFPPRFRCRCPGRKRCCSVPLRHRSCPPVLPAPSYSPRRNKCGSGLLFPRRASALPSAHRP